MSIEVMALVLHHATGTTTERLVLLGIANHQGDGGAWPTVATLAKYAGITERNVQKTIASLVKSEQLRVHVQAGGTQTQQTWSRPNLYEVLVRCPADCDRTPHHRVSQTTPPPGVADDAPRVSPATPKPSLEPLSPSERDTRARAVPVTSWSGPDDNLYNWAKEQGWTGSAVDFQAAAMRDWALSKAEKKVDWNAALRNWLRRQTPPPPPRSSGGAPIPSGWR